MDGQPGSPMPWSAYPDVPIYLDVQGDRSILKTYGTTPTTPTTPTAPEITVDGRPPRLDTSHLTSGPANVSPATTIQTSSDRSVIWPIPEPPPEVIQQPQTRRPLLRFFPTDRPRVRLDVPSTQPIDEKVPGKLEAKRATKLDLGLGICDGPPKPPSIRIQPPPFENEKAEAPANIAQRIEERLWRWNASGNVMERWMLEIVSWLISAICMGAIIAVLIVLRDQPASKWPFDNIGLTLNTFVSILSRIAGAALLLPVAEALGQLKWSWFIKGDSKKMWDFEMFDNASRGPWGAFLLLIHTKGKTIAALGALVTIFCLALDPFFQQVVDFPVREILRSTNSSIPRVVRYEPVYPVEFINGVSATQSDPDILPVADLFFLGNGTQPVEFGSGTRAEIPLSCPTSKCTWPSYETLAICSECVEIPQLLTFACKSMRVDWTSELNATVESHPNATVCGHFLNATSNEPILMSGYMVDDRGNPSGETLLMRTLPLITNPLREALWGGSIHFKRYRNPIVDVLISSTVNSTQVHANEAPALHECVVSWCVKTIQSSYDMATYQENVTKIYINDTKGDFPWSTTDFGEEGVDTNYLENVTISAPLNNGKYNADGWGIDNITMSNIVEVFDRLFPGFTTVANDTDEPLLRWRTGSFTQVRTRTLDFNPWLLPNNVTRHVERFAQAISNVLRSSSSSEQFQGQSFDKEVFVSVRWAWLSLPVGLLLVSFVFLLATVIKSATEKGQVSIRKNSAIATLLYGLPDHYQKRLAKSNSKGTPRAKAKELKVRLSATRGWRASGDVFSPMTPTVPRNLPPPGWI
ncbi:hypothetical protein ACN47E_000064 [Coniothyrium glycines]